MSEDEATSLMEKLDEFEKQKEAGAEPEAATDGGEDENDDDNEDADAERVMIFDKLSELTDRVDSVQVTLVVVLVLFVFAALQ